MHNNNNNNSHRRLNQLQARAIFKETTLHSRDHAHTGGRKFMHNSWTIIFLFMKKNADLVEEGVNTKSVNKKCARLSATTTCLTLNEKLCLKVNSKKRKSRSF